MVITSKSGLFFEIDFLLNHDFFFLRLIFDVLLLTFLLHLLLHGDELIDGFFELQQVLVIWLKRQNLAYNAYFCPKVF